VNIEEFFEHEDDVSSMSEDDSDNDDEDYDKVNEELEDGFKKNNINYDVNNLYFKDDIPEERLEAQFAELDKHLSKVIKRNRKGKLTHIDEAKLRLAKLHEDIKLPPIPKNIIEAYDSEHADEWLKAIDELKQLKDAGAYRVVKPGKVFQSSLNNELNLKYEDLILFAFCDASYDITNGHSRLGGAFYLGYESGCFSYFSKKDITISNSAMEAEVRAIERTIRKVVIYRDLLKEIGHIQLEPTVIYSDSNASVLHFQHYKNSNKLRHLMKLLHTIRHAVNQGWIILKFIKGEFNVADGLTKLLSKDKFLQFQTWLFYGYHYLGECFFPPFEVSKVGVVSSLRSNEGECSSHSIQ
jgi:hypothetical protein